jgi:hypothetical protein
LEDYAAYLLEEANSDIAALHQFKILYNNEQDAYHFFFEGEEDSLFYMPEARRRIGNKETFIYDCGGKRNVIEVRDEIKRDGYNVEFCLFFVDRDFDDFLKSQVYIDEYTYITDNYSIENDMANLQAAQILLDDVMRISRADPEYKRIKNVITTAFDSFYNEIRPLMAWILAAKESGCSPNLGNTVGLKGVVSLKGTKPDLTRDGFLEFKKKVVVNGRLPAMSAVLKWRRVLDPALVKRWVRGKYDIWFFQVILVATLEETNLRRKAAGGRRIRIPSSLRDGRLFEVLGGRIPPPASLEAFFETRLH